MNSILYRTGVICLCFFWLPRLLIGKKRRHYRSILKQKLGLTLPDPSLFVHSRPLIWIHAASVGETKASTALYIELRRGFPQAQFAISAVTQTGYVAAREGMPGADVYIYFPIDLSCIARRLIRRLRPAFLLLVEAERWYNTMKEVRRQGGKVVAVNGKISAKTVRRLTFVPRFAKALFRQYDACCVQTWDDRNAFLKMGVSPEKIWVTGNLKWDHPVLRMSEEETARWKVALGMVDATVVTVGSTHPEEESAILDALGPMLAENRLCKVILAPRHPERFAEVRALLNTKGISWRGYSSLQDTSGTAQVLLLDTLGKLCPCYQIASVAIVGGSFFPGVGGHNLYEPAEYGVPVVFGPYIEQQKTYAQELLVAGGGFCMEVEQLYSFLTEILSDRCRRDQAGAVAFDVVQGARGAAARTSDIITRL